VADSTVAVREVLETMVELPVPDSFRFLGMKAQLAGDDHPCPVCAPLRGNHYDPHDPDAPRLPISGDASKCSAAPAGTSERTRAEPFG
jgi:hypothetical protein